ncbi:DNA polymerase III subunit epsilon [Commensalibacter papalotli (ex Servin-Garciduenas et al. 2014)]|uniref:DNA polymerase III subunit epsilon n=1 Tax=Commensalibacter papalotli (ex Servin-Garciduenas et al. 2014) TaxID=1208583 RepID=W7E1A3_9PROT|nr:DNA polymerase III subunit epsilon [Commensalibacter papalotli (ex Servin-Garciduenas et al. 2014)]EUK18844.1 DNA polymerase III subunit epsilon [Commensalibacter papalotli (ex Servin-Garciduenas et al. 2014)]
MNQRSVLFDTETTGVDPLKGDRIIEIAAIELINDLPTDNYYHALINPERDIPIEATRVHGMTIEDLKGKPKFKEIADDFLEFIQDDPLVAHNAPFDFKFVNAELSRIKRSEISLDRMVDTLKLARAKYPLSPNSLDALCRRFSIDLSARTTHNALLDCKLLSEVYIQLTGGRQRGLGFASQGSEKTGKTYQKLQDHMPIFVKPTEQELEQHKKFIEKNIPEALWHKNS